MAEELTGVVLPDGELQRLWEVATGTPAGVEVSAGVALESSPSDPVLAGQLELIEAMAKPDATSADKLLGSITLRALLIKQMQAELDVLAPTARSQRVIWKRIGQAMGVGQKTVRSRWDPEARRYHRTYQQGRQKNGQA